MRIRKVSWGKHFCHLNYTLGCDVLMGKIMWHSQLKVPRASQTHPCRQRGDV